MKINKKCLDDAYSATFDLEFLKTKKKEKSNKYKKTISKRKNSYDHDSASLPRVSNTNNSVTSVSYQINSNVSHTLDPILFDIQANMNSSSEKDFENQVISDDRKNNRHIKNNFFNGLFLKKYLFNGSQVDVHDFYLAVYSLKLKHSLNKKTIDDFLKLIKIILPKDNNCPKSYEKIEKFLSNEEKTHSVLFCCVNCKSLSNQDISLESLNTQTNICKKCSNEISPFVTFNIKSRITQILENENLFNQVIKNNNRQDNSQSLYDMNNGTIYKQMQKNSKSLAISLVLNTDGAPITNSNNYNMWPILGTIVELEQSSRENFKNMVILGIWLSKQKPVYNIFVENSIKELIDLKDKNIHIKGIDFTIRAHSIIMDLPAKAAVLNVKQFNGEFGCIHCYHPGEHSGIYNKRIYPPLKFDKRKDTEFSEMVDLSVKTGQTICGIKGPNPISNILSLPSQAPLDYMHLVLQGHAKWLIKQYFFSDKTNDFYIGDKLSMINQLLKQQKIPHNITRSVKCLDDKIKLKSSEIKILLFYQIIPLLYKILPDFYFNLLVSYVFSIRFLYEPINDVKRIGIAQDMLEKYVGTLDDAFGKYAYDYTIHAHLHLSDQVYKHGPLYSHSQFVFEGAIYNLKKKMHGTKGYLNQLICQINDQMSFSTMLKPENFKSEELYNFCYKNSNNYKFEQIETNQLLQPFEKKSLSSEDQVIFNRFFGTNGSTEQIVCAYRSYMDKRVYHSIQYKRRLQSNSYSVCIDFNGKEFYGNIDYFFKFKKREFCFINIYNSRLITTELFGNNSNCFSKFVSTHFNTFYAVYNQNNIHVNRQIIPCREIKSKCIEVNTSRYKFITKLAYEFEHD